MLSFGSSVVESTGEGDLVSCKIKFPLFSWVNWSLRNNKGVKYCQEDIPASFICFHQDFRYILQCYHLTLVLFFCASQYEIYLSNFSTFSNFLIWNKKLQFPFFTNYLFLLLFCRFLATGRNFRDFSFTFKLGFTTIIKIVESMVTLLWECLQWIHVKSPTSEDFLKIANDFYNIWNFLNTIDAIDEKHIRLKCPSNSGTMYYNYKQFFSIVLQAIADAHGKFIIVEIRRYGKQNDGGTFRSSKMFELMKKGNLNISVDSPLPEISNPMPFIGDKVYSLLRYLLKPYNRKNLDP